MEADQPACPPWNPLPESLGMYTVSPESSTLGFFRWGLALISACSGTSHALEIFHRVSPWATVCLCLYSTGGVGAEPEAAGIFTFCPTAI
ncbi:hypothetical protein D3C72_2196710 [compost metagenome]